MWCDSGMCGVWCSGVDVCVCVGIGVCGVIVVCVVCGVDKGGGGGRRKEEEGEVQGGVGWCRKTRTPLRMWGKI